MAARHQAIQPAPQQAEQKQTQDTKNQELKQKRKDHILRIFLYLIFIPAGCFTSWWLVWRLVRWLLWSI